MKIEVKQGKMLWYALYRPAKKHISEFEKDKIVIKAIGKNLAFSIAEKGVYISAPSSFMTSNFNKYIISILSSKLVRYFIYQNSDRTGAGDIMLNIQSFEQIPIPNIPKEQQTPFKNLVDTIMESKEKITKYNKHFNSLNAVDKIEIKEAIENLEAEVEASISEIDRLVYGLYGLSGDEVGIVENG